MKSSLIVKRLPASCAVLALLSLLAVGGCNNSGVKVSSSQNTLTPIDNCVVNSENDVVIGGSKAAPNCQTVEMKPSSNYPADFDEISIQNGGTLIIDGGTGATAQSASAQARTSIPLTPLETPVNEICVGNGGTLKFTKGTANQPITSDHKVILLFRGKKESSESMDICPNFKKGIDVLAGGSLLMYGAKGIPQDGGTSWTTLAAPAGSNVAGAKVASSGLKTLHLSADVTKGPEGWQYGDWIVVGTTDYTPFHTEFVQILSVTSNSSANCASSSDGCSTVTLMQPLKYYHFGSLPPSSSTSVCADPFNASKTQPAFLCDGPTRNYGVDERAEVGLISRDIELTSATSPITSAPPSATSSEHWGGEIMIHAGFKQVAIQGVRLSKFGKDQLGSYPIHFHKVGDAGNKPVINADSVDHSYNKCVTIHDTSNLTIQNMVCARIVGHIFYEELDAKAQADDGNITFKHDLGLGAMSNAFDINPVTVGGTQITREQLIHDYWWAGDNMTNGSNSLNDISYDGFNIPDTDNWLQPTHGSCTTYAPDGGFSGYTPVNGSSAATACNAPQIYIEPASGFWIQNPNTTLIDNAIGGCQGVGRGFWWVPPQSAVNVNGSDEELQFQPLGTFRDNRAHACYSGFYGENEYSVHSGQLFPHQGGKNASPSIIATLDGMTATRNRFRGVWLRPVWFVIKNGHFASNRENVSLVTSGGIDGNAPGVWDLLEDSAIMGFSENNVGRWGPCPQAGVLGPNTGSHFGCIDHTPPPPAATKLHSGAEVGLGYTPPSWNDFGYMLYDGPVRVFHDRFINFNHDAADGSNPAFSNELDDADRQFLVSYSAANQSPTGQKPFVYEGDAAFGWFQSNQSAYPTGTASRELMWVNTTLRHQIYTELVGVNTNFNDGDKNTAIIDEDGTLTGLGVKVGDPAKQTHAVHPISLNNLPFNATSNSVDECLSRGTQNELYEGRESSLISPSTMGTLEFSDLYPFLKNKVTNPADYPGDTNTHWQDLTFRRDDAVPLDKNGNMFHPTMVMQTGRNGLGIWEPKVSNGYGYTVMASKTTAPAVPSNQNSGKAGIWKWIELGLADIVDPNITASNPFYIQLGINYTNKDGTHPADNFTITRGYKSYVGGNIWQGDQELLKYWTPQVCNNLDSLNVNNVPWSGNSYKPGCPSGNTSTLKEVSSIAGLTNSDGTPNLGVYYYNATTGYLYLNVAQDEPNPVAPSPTGSCANGNSDPACPDVANGESYYACPKTGCIIYSIAQNDPNYDPGPSVGMPAATSLKPAPANPNQLVLHGTSTVITRQLDIDKQSVPFHTATNGPACTPTEP